MVLFFLSFVFLVGGGWGGVGGGWLGGVGAGKVWIT